MLYIYDQGGIAIFFVLLCFIFIIKWIFVLGFNYNQVKLFVYYCYHTFFVLLCFIPGIYNTVIFVLCFIYYQLIFSCTLCFIYNQLNFSCALFIYG